MLYGKITKLKIIFCHRVVLNFRQPADLESMLQYSDYIVNVMPSTPETDNMLGNTVLSAAT